MSLEKYEMIGAINITSQRKENGKISMAVSVRTDMVIEEDGEEISRKHHRKVLQEGSDLKNEDPLVKKVCKAIWG